MNYFQTCVQDECVRRDSMRIENITTERVREALEELRGTKEADVIISLALQIEKARENIAAIKDSLIKGKMGFQTEMWRYTLLSDLEFWKSDFFR